MRRLDVADVWKVVSPRHRKVHLRNNWAEIGLLILRLAAVGLVIWIGWLHLNLWSDGYRHIPSIGPLFLVAAVSATVVALGMLLRPSRLLALAGIGLAGGILGGLIASINVGLFGFTESLSAPSTVESIVLEVAAALTLASWVALDMMVETRTTKRVVTADSRTSPSTKGRPMVSSITFQGPARDRGRSDSR